MKLIAISPSSKFAIMQEYVGFNFPVYGDEVQVSSLKGFLRKIDSDFDFNGFEHFPLIMIKDVANGLSCLHKLEISHRDLKPANILVSNQHYNETNLEEIYTRRPVVCKLADFGESRSDIVHTRAMLLTHTVKMSNVNDFNRGTAAFSSPELLVKELRTKFMSQEELSKADVWAFGMVIFSILNSNQAYPYQKNLEKKVGNGEVAKEVISF